MPKCRTIHTSQSSQSISKRTIYFTVAADSFFRSPKISQERLLDAKVFVANYLCCLWTERRKPSMLEESIACFGENYSQQEKGMSQANVEISPY